MSTRLVALVRENEERQPKHFVGLPPELTEGKDTRQRLALPRVLLVEARTDGVFLFRFTDDGGFGGDTWHGSIEEAKQQAQYEYGTMADEWREVPDEITNVVAFALGSTE